jgi:hypothetical protein
MTLALAVELAEVAEQEREQRLLADGPIDDFELNRMLIQDLADYDDDPEVRAAAAAVLPTEDPVEFAAFLDDALPGLSCGGRQAQRADRGDQQGHADGVDPDRRADPA